MYNLQLANGIGDMDVDFFVLFSIQYTVLKILQTSVMEVAAGSDPSICKKNFFPFFSFLI